MLLLRMELISINHEVSQQTDDHSETVKYTLCEKHFMKDNLETHMKILHEGKTQCQYCDYF